MPINQKSLGKIINVMHQTQEDELRQSHMLYYINQLLDADKTLFLGKKEIPKRGLTRNIWQNKEAIFINDISQNEHYEKALDPHLDNIYSLLLYPVTYQGQSIGMLASIGKGSYSKTEEQIIPLKSGEQTIGVTVKEMTIEVPPHHFTQEDLETIDEVLPALLKALYLEKESPEDMGNVDNKKKHDKLPKEQGFFQTTFNKVKKIFT